MPQKIMPWCIKGNAMVSNVLSWPPCSEEVEVKTPAGLLINAPVNQSGLVPSRKYFNGAAMLPKRVGLPITKPAQCLRSDRKSTRLNSSHVRISYAVFCLKKKNKYVDL